MFIAQSTHLAATLPHYLSTTLVLGEFAMLTPYHSTSRHVHEVTTFDRHIAITAPPDHRPLDLTADGIATCVARNAIMDVHRLPIDRTHI